MALAAQSRAQLTILTRAKFYNFVLLIFEFEYLPQQTKASITALR